MLPTLSTPTLNRLPAAVLAPMLMLCTAASATSAAHLVPVPNYDAALQRQIAEMSSRVQATVGQLVMALGSVPRYRHFTFGEVQSLLVEPLIRERILIASPRTGPDDGQAPGPVAAVAFWASVSPAVDQKIREQIKTGVFPIRLGPDDWTSGDTVWLLDLVAPSKETATNVLAHFGTMVKEPSKINAHPIVVQQVASALVTAEEEN